MVKDIDMLGRETKNKTSGLIRKRALLTTDVSTYCYNYWQKRYQGK